MLGGLGALRQTANQAPITSRWISSGAELPSKGTMSCNSDQQQQQQQQHASSLPSPSSTSSPSGQQVGQQQQSFQQPLYNNNIPSNFYYSYQQNLPHPVSATPTLRQPPNTYLNNTFQPSYYNYNSQGLVSPVSSSPSESPPFSPSGSGPLQAQTQPQPQPQPLHWAAGSFTAIPGRALHPIPVLVAPSNHRRRRGVRHDSMTSFAPKRAAPDSESDNNVNVNVNADSSSNSNANANPNANVNANSNDFGIGVNYRHGDVASNGTVGNTNALVVASARPPKVARTDLGPQSGFSETVRDRLSLHTRAGQACDRCKVRKIRCDTSEGTCGHCQTLNIVCYVTDRTTGRTTERGYVQKVERINVYMKERMADLEQLLQERGIQVKEMPDDSEFNVSNVSGDIEGNDNENEVDPQGDESAGAWAKYRSLLIKHRDANSPFSPASSRSRLESRPENSHLGVVRDDEEPLSSIKGTRVSILGQTLEVGIADEPLEAAGGPGTPFSKSLLAFIDSIQGGNNVQGIELPPRSEAFQFVEWYFSAIYVFLPVLHKPSFIRLLSRFYDEPDFVPSAAEFVCTHMVFAIMYFQTGVRNQQQGEQYVEFNRRSDMHYHYALSRFFKLVSSPTVAAAQAMAMISTHTRSFAKPGCAAFAANMALQKALELGLHREPEKPDCPGGTNLDVEIRKRVWWAILTVSVALDGRRGRPMPIVVEEFDVSFPEPIADECLSNEGVDTSQQAICPYNIGIAGFKVIPIYLEMYSRMYSVRRNAKSYVSVVRALEQRIEAWRDGMPDYMKLENHDNSPEDAGRLVALYAQIYYLEFKLCLRHPSVAMTDDATIKDENMRICDGISKEMLHAVKQIQELRALDTTWYQLSVYVASIFSTLAAHYHRRLEVTHNETEHLKADMASWLSIIEDMDRLLVSGNGVCRAVRDVINNTIIRIEQDQQNRGANHPLLMAAPHAGQPSQSSSTQAQVQPQPQLSAPQLQQQGHLDFSTPQATPSSAPLHLGQAAKDYYNTQTQALTGQMSYPAMYNDQSGNGFVQTPQTYGPNPAMYYHGATSTAVPGTSIAGGSAQSNPLTTFASQATEHMSGQPPLDLMWNQRHGRDSGYSDWAKMVSGNSDQIIPGSLAGMGGEGQEPLPVTGVQDGSVGMSMNAFPQQWPHCLFNQPPHGNPQ